MIQNLKTSTWVPLTPLPLSLELPRFDLLARRMDERSEDGTVIRAKAVYQQHWIYRNTEGAKLFYVMRIGWENRDGKKADIPVSWCEEQETGRFSWCLKAPLRPRPLYCLDRLAASPEAQVLVVEGQKSADGACNFLPDGWVAVASYGGAQGAKAADWSALADRCVAIWPDNDLAGLGYAEAVASFALSAGARVVRVIPLPSGLPPKWDLGDPLPSGLSVEEVRARIDGTFPEPLAVKAEASGDTRSISDGDIPISPATGPDHPYFFGPNGTYMTKLVKDEHVQVRLGNFQARIREEHILDDGAERHRVYAIDGTLAGGAHLPILRVRADHFPAMAWINGWGSGAVVGAGMAIRDHFRAAIQHLSEGVEVRTVFSHTGWHNLENRWIYLHAAGAIDASGVVPDIEVNLPGTLAGYCLEAPLEGQDLVAGIRESVRLLDIDADAVTIPLFASVFRAPLGYAKYSLHLTGKTGAMKSTKAALFLSFFGRRWSASELPAAWMDTANSLFHRQFRLKDMPLLVDEAVPEGGARGQSELARTMAAVLRSQGNGHARDRLDRDAELRPSRNPRGSLWSTGEDLPQGHSLCARTWIMYVLAGSGDLASITRAQAIGQAGLFARVMASYVQWLAPRMNGMDDRVHDRTIELRRRFRGAHLRTPEIAADLLVGVEHFLSFAREEKTMTQQEAEEILDRAVAALSAECRSQTRTQQESDPVSRFLALLEGALAMGKCHLEGFERHLPSGPERWGWRTDPVQGIHRPQGNTVGFVAEDGRMYLLPEAVYTVVRKMSEEQGAPINMSQRVLWARMADAGILYSPERDRTVHNSPTIRGRRSKVIYLPQGVARLSESGTDGTACVPGTAPQQKERNLCPESPDGHTGGLRDNLNGESEGHGGPGVCGAVPSVPNLLLRCSQSPDAIRANGGGGPRGPDHFRAAIVYLQGLRARGEELVREGAALRCPANATPGEVEMVKILQGDLVRLLELAPEELEAILR